MSLNIHFLFTQFLGKLLEPLVNCIQHLLCQDVNAILYLLVNFPVHTSTLQLELDILFSPYCLLFYLCNKTNEITATLQFREGGYYAMNFIIFSPLISAVLLYSMHAHYYGSLEYIHSLANFCQQF